MDNTGPVDYKIFTSWLANKYGMPLFWYHGWAYKILFQLLAVGIIYIGSIILQFSSESGAIDILECNHTILLELYLCVCVTSPVGVAFSKM